MVKKFLCQLAVPLVSFALLAGCGGRNYRSENLEPLNQQTALAEYHDPAFVENAIKKCNKLAESAPEEYFKEIDKKHANELRKNPYFALHLKSLEESRCLHEESTTARIRGDNKSSIELGDISQKCEINAMTLYRHFIAFEQGRTFEAAEQAQNTQTRSSK